MPHHSTVLSPLQSLLKKYIPWMWSKIEEDALLLDSQTLVYYDHTLSLFLSRDASSYGGGAVLSHKTGGQFRPVAFASATLTSAQQK